MPEVGPNGPKRTHAVCWICKEPLTTGFAHCNSRNCPWCAKCYKAAEERAS